MAAVIRAIEQVTPSWLTQVLRQGGYLERGEVVAVRPGDRGRATASGPGFDPSHRLAVSYSDDAPPSAPRQLYLKTYDEAIYAQAGRLEVTFYTAIAPEMPYPPAAHCYHAAYDAETGAFHLLLQDVSETHRAVHPESPAPRPDVEQMLDALAQLHAYWWAHPRLGKGVGMLPTSESVDNEFTILRDAFPGYVDFLGDRLSTRRRGIYERVLAALPGVLVQHLAHGRLTLVHNDAHAGNFLLANDPDKQSSYIVDWEQWGVWAGLRDVAYLIALFWYPERRGRMEASLVRHYHHLLCKYGVNGYDWHACWHDYRLHAIENLLVPFWAWVDGTWDGFRGYHRWHQLEKAMLAFDDLACAALLES
jgi:hypothetical protein